MRTKIDRAPSTSPSEHESEADSSGTISVDADEVICTSNLNFGFVLFYYITIYFIPNYITFVITIISCLLLALPYFTTTNEAFPTSVLPGATWH